MKMNEAFLNNRIPIILVLGGGFTQADVVKSAIPLGMRVVVVDANPEAYCKRKFPEITFLNTSFTDTEAVINLLDHIGIKPDCVVAYGSDLSVMSQAILANHYGIKGHNIEVAQNLRDKLSMMKLWKEAGFAVPPFVEIDSLGVLQEIDIEERVGFPLVVKPSDASAQRGVRLIREKKDLEKALAFAFRFSKKVIFSKYIEGIELAVTTYHEEGVGKTILITERLTLDPDKHLGICHAHLFPPRISSDLIEKVKTTLVRAAEVLGVKEGPTYSQVILHNGDIYLLEMGGRFGGGRDSELYQLITGIDNIEVYLKRLLFGESGFNKLVFPSKDKGAIVKFLIGKEGKLKDVIVPKEVKEQFVSFNLFYEIGDYIPPLESASGRIGYFILEGSNPDELLQKANSLSSQIKVVVE